jgi:hypothetical protein
VDVETAFPLHTVQLFSVSNFPISQLVHCVAPEVTNSPAAFLASEPGSHWAQLADPAALNVRGGQKSQLKLSVTLPFFPGWQLWQDPSLSDPNSPAPQRMQSLALSWLAGKAPMVNLPASQVAQVEDPATALYSFTGQMSQSSRKWPLTMCWPASPALE